MAHEPDPISETSGASQGTAAAAKRAREKVSDVTDSIREKANELSQQTQAKVDESRESAAGALESTASRIHQAAEMVPRTEKLATAAHRTAEALEGTAEYLRSHDTSAMVDDLGRIVRRYPTQTLLAAGALGFVLGRVFKRA